MQDSQRSTVLSVPPKGVERETLPQAGTRPRVSGQHIRTLVVGGSPLLQAGVSAALSHDPHLRVVALMRTARDAIGQLQSCDVLILNADLPQSEAAALLQRLPAGSTVKILVLTDNANIDEMLSTLRLGVHGYGIRSTLTPQELCAGVAAVVQWQSWACAVATRHLMSNASRAGAVGDRHGANELLGTGESRELTSREVEVLRLAARGSGEQHIAEALFLSRNTVKTYFRRVCLKLGVHSRSDAIRVGFQRGLIPDRRQTERARAA